MSTINIIIQKLMELEILIADECTNEEFLIYCNEYDKLATQLTELKLNKE